MDKLTLINTLKSTRAEWDALLNRVDAARMVEPGVVGDWSVKDLIAHVTWYENEMVDLIDSRSMDHASPWWAFRDDPRNARIHELNLERTLDDIQAESRQTAARLFAAVETLTEDDLHDPARFSGMPDDWTPWKLIAMNTYDHYTHHMIDLRRWLA